MWWWLDVRLGEVCDGLFGWRAFSWDGLVETQCVQCVHVIELKMIFQRSHQAGIDWRFVCCTSMARWSSCVVA